MTEIGLLMTGVLSTTQPNLPRLPEQQPLVIENGVQKPNTDKLSLLSSTSQITPPEFMTTDRRERTQISVMASQGNQVLKQIRQKHQFYSFQIADAQDISTQKQLIARYPAYQKPRMPTLRFGSAGTSVRVMQRLLVSKGYGVEIDGIFGPLTEIAIRAFQNQRNLSVDGVVGQKTWSELSN
ncbi:MAG: peptidoglycan-binding protein [Nostocales cyanobacterium]|nr:MAG: peptidoglycan-binding protein [Nostocales cyanobacterium]TAF12879.1 MAG: peptidoglycan-binding protein [Nostocales cyanobacterium]